MMRRIRAYAKKVARRFLRNTPRNSYEKIAFDAARSVLTVFGEVQPV